MSTENARYAVCRVTSDGRVTRLGPPALTASAAQAAYAGQLREGVPPRLSRATHDALASARQRLRAEREERDRQRELRERRERRERGALAAWAAGQEW